MDLSSQKSDFSTENENFYHFYDYRPSTLINSQSLLIKQLSLKNKTLFDATEKKTKKQAIPLATQEAHFSNGWFCTYTDNISRNTYFEHKSVILTVHGCPGDENDWKALEYYFGDKFCRWINFIVPGFD